MAALHDTLTSWTGKALGATAALILAPPNPGALTAWMAAGMLLGHGFDSLGARPWRARQRQAHDRAGLRFTFAALGRIAQTAGRLDPEHLREAERLMARLAFTAERRREAWGWFHAGRGRAFPFDAAGSTCRDEFAAHPVLEGLAIQSLCRMAALVDRPQASSELLALGACVGWAPEELVRRATSVDVSPALPAGSEGSEPRAVLGRGDG